MQLSELRIEARSIFNEIDAANSHISESQLTAWANEAIRFILTRLGSIPITERAYTAADTISLNANTLSICEVYMNKQPENKYSELVIIDQDQLNAIDPNWLSADSGIPEYLVRADTFTARLYPSPNTDNTGQTIKVFALEFPTALSGDSDTPSGFPKNIHDIIPHYMAYRAFKQLGMDEKSVAELILVNGVLKSQQAITIRFSSKRNRWLWTGNDESN